MRTLYISVNYVTKWALPRPDGAAILGEARVRLTPAHVKVARAQGGITPGPEEGEPGADFTNLGTGRFGTILFAYLLLIMESWPAVSTQTRRQQKARR